MSRIDDYENKPTGMSDYLSTYGWHFSKSMADFASQKFCKGMKLIDSQTLTKISEHTNIMQNNKGYDAHYLCNKLRTIHPTMSESTMLAMVDDILANSYDTATFTEFYADCLANDIPIIWEDMI